MFVYIAFLKSTLKLLGASGGFVSNFRRGTGHMFSAEALDEFLTRNSLSHVIRAHEVKEAGFQVYSEQIYSIQRLRSKPGVFLTMTICTLLIIGATQSKVADSIFFISLLQWL